MPLKAPSFVMTPEDMAALHARAFTNPRPWSLAEFRQIAAAPGTLIRSNPHAFVIARVIGPEAEILTIATDPAHQAQGHGRALLTLMHDDLASAGVEEVFLEVADTNSAARALYGAMGYVQRGRRADYYGPGIAALVLARPLAPAKGD